MYNEYNYIHVAMVFGNNNHKLHRSMLANNSNASRLSSHDLNGELQQTDLIITNVHVYVIVKQWPRVVYLIYTRE